VIEARNYHGKYVLTLVIASIFLTSSFMLVQDAFADQATAPQAPSGLNATTISLSQINLKWNGPANDGINMESFSSGNNGVNNGATFTSGKIDQALSFDGTDDVVTIPNSSTLNFGSTGSFTISTWIKSTQSGPGNPGFGLILDHRRNNDGTYAGYSIEDGSGTIYARIRDSSAHDVAAVSTSNVNDGMYHNIVFVVNRTAQTESLYIDNALQDSKNILTVDNINTGFGLYVGGTASPNTLVNFFNGTIDQTRIYNRVLSTQEIQQLYTETSSSSVPTSGLVGEWKFDGNTLDTSTDKNSSSGAVFTSGKINQALSFDGADDAILVPNSSTLNFGNTGSFTASTWIKSTQSGTGNPGFGLIIDHRRNNDGIYAGYSIEDNSGTIYGRIRDSAAHDVATVSATNVNDGMYHNIVFVVDRSTQTERLYVDNMLQSVQSIASVGNINTAFDLYLGGTASPNTPVNFFNGTIDQTRIYNRVLSPQEIQQLYTETSSSSLPTGGLVGEWKFDGSTLDTSGMGSSTGGSPITGYKMERSTDNGSTWSTLVSNTGSTATTYSDTGLSSNTTYAYRVSAINSVGTSNPSNTASATTGAPTNSIIMNNIQSTSGTVSSSNQITLANFNSGNGNNPLLVVGVETNNNDVMSITFGGTPLSQAVKSFYNNDAEFWYLKNPTGTGDIVVTTSGPTSAVVGAYSLSGVDQTNPVPTSMTNHNTASSSPTISITTQYRNSLVLDLSSIYGGVTLGSPTCTQGWDVNVPDAITGASSSTIVPTPSSVNCSWTASQGGDLWDDVAVEIKASK